MCEVPLNDSANGGSVSGDVSFMYGEYGFNFKRSWSYSRQWIWNLRTKIMLPCFREVKCH